MPLCSDEPIGGGETRLRMTKEATLAALATEGIHDLPPVPRSTVLAGKHGNFSQQAICQSIFL